MDEPRISGPPQVIGWTDRGPVLEVPLSYPADWIWIAALERTPGVSHRVHWMADEGRLVLECASTDSRTALAWLVGFIEKVGEQATEMRHAVSREQASIEQWWES